MPLNSLDFVMHSKTPSGQLPRSSVLILILVTSLLCGEALAHHESKTKKIELLYQDQSVVNLGETRYQDLCAGCHGRNLQGQVNWHKRDQDGYLPAPPHDETGHTWHHADKLLFEMTKYGLQAIAGGDYKTRMPALRELYRTTTSWRCCPTSSPNGRIRSFRSITSRSINNAKVMLALQLPRGTTD